VSSEVLGTPSSPDDCGLLLARVVVKSTSKSLQIEFPAASPLSPRGRYTYIFLFDLFANAVVSAGGNAARQLRVFGGEPRVVKRLVNRHSSPKTYRNGYHRHTTGLPCATTQNTGPSRVIWEQRVALAQLRNRVPIKYNGTPQIHP